MNDDLVKRLRLGACALEIEQAADRIEELSNCVAVLEAKLAKAVDALQLADDNLTNLQPKIEQLVPAPWTAVIDGYVDPVIKTARATLAELKGQDDEPF